MRNLNPRLVHARKRRFTTMDLTNLIDAGKNIEEKLIEIRERFGVPPWPYSTRPVKIEIREVLGNDLREDAQIHPEQPIIEEGEFYMAYIKDHQDARFYSKEKHDAEVDNHPNLCFVSGKKVHFYYCEALVDMNENGRRARYQVTRKTENTRIIDLNDGEVETRLALCKLCATILCHNGELSASGEEFPYKDTRKKIAEYGNAEELMTCVKAYYNNDPSAIKKIQNFIKNTNTYMKGIT